GTAPTGTISPATATLCPGATISLSVSGGTSYQWYRNGVKIDGATAATYSASQAGEYTADIISGDCQGKSSNAATLTAGTAPTGTISPATATLCPGATISLSVSGGTSYQWYRNGVKIDGATAATYSASQAGEYTADIISGDCQGKSSNAATLTAGTAPTGTISPATATLCPGATISLSVSGGTS
ncbi:beta-xylosidase, partial [Flavisolibacter sp. BT320]|nr:beta-xylosidase [Flavisolibacter longurius]